MSDRVSDLTGNGLDNRPDPMTPTKFEREAARAGHWENVRTSLLEEARREILGRLRGGAQAIGDVRELPRIEAELIGRSPWLRSLEIALAAERQRMLRDECGRRVTFVPWEQMNP